MNWWGIILASLLAAALGALGMGGGGILVLYLTAYRDMEQLTAQGINLVFFVPVAVVALIIHQKNHLIRWKTAFPCILLGLCGVWLGTWLAALLGSGMLSKLFAGFLLLIGLRELLAKGERTPKDKK